MNAPPVAAGVRVEVLVVVAVTNLNCPTVPAAKVIARFVAGAVAVIATVRL